MNTKDEKLQLNETDSVDRQEATLSDYNRYLNWLTRELDRIKDELTLGEILVDKWKDNHPGKRFKELPVKLRGSWIRKRGH